MKTGWEEGCKLIDKGSGDVYEVVMVFNELRLKDQGTGYLYGHELTKNWDLEPFGGTKVKNAGMYVFPTQQEADKFCERIEPAAPFTREEIDALIREYPGAYEFRFGSELVWKAMRKVYPTSEREVCFHYREANCEENQIEVWGERTLRATWTKGEPLPSRRNVIPVAPDIASPIIEDVMLNLRKQNPNADITYKDGGIYIGARYPSMVEQVTVDLLFDDKPQIQTTHTFSAELPDGRVVEMPPPDGEGWTQVEREEFKRGDMRYHNYTKDNQKLELTDCRTDTRDQYLVSHPEWIHDFAMRFWETNAPILSITTWRREVAPEPPEEDPYDYHCASKQPLRGTWPERLSEAE